MKYALYILFSTYGEIKELVVKKNNRMRGQAFVVFKEVSDATAAKTNLDRYVVFEKAIVSVGLCRGYSSRPRGRRYSTSMSKSDLSYKMFYSLQTHHTINFE